MTEARAPFEEAYRRYWDVVVADTVAATLAHISYEPYVMAATSFEYGLQEEQFTRELLNTFNQFATTVHRLAIWEVVLNLYPDDEQIDLRFEFTRALLYYALHQPAEFRARLIYCSVKLCYQIGLETKLLLAADLKEDHEIALNELKKVGKHWVAGRALVRAIEAIDAAAYRNATGNFRNRQQHRIGRGLDVGLTSVVTRGAAESGGISYSFGVEQPLATADVLPILVQQAARMGEGFAAYWELVGEQSR